MSLDQRTLGLCRGWPRGQHYLGSILAGPLTIGATWPTTGTAPILSRLNLAEPSAGGAAATIAHPASDELGYLDRRRLAHELHPAVAVELAAHDRPHQRTSLIWVSSVHGVLPLLGEPTGPETSNGHDIPIRHRASSTTARLFWGGQGLALRATATSSPNIGQTLPAS